MPAYLVIQTAFIGDVVLSTAVIEKLHRFYPDAGIDFLVRKGNEGLFQNHPFLRNLLVWDKKKNKNRNLLRLLKTIRANRYDAVINLQRFASTGILTAFSGAGERIGFSSNPMSFLFSRRVPHHFDPKQPRHEVERNNDLIAHFTDQQFTLPALYPSREDYAMVTPWQEAPYITISPSSVWFTKQYPLERWVHAIDQFPPGYRIFLLGGPDNRAECESLKARVKYPSVEVLAGKLSFLQSAALMKGASMNFVNDSAPLHFTSALNAPVTAIFCSTAPVLGYYPLSKEATVVEVREPLPCRPCGWHGHRQCPKGHFQCALKIDEQDILKNIPAL